MPTVTVSPRHQIVIPKEIRESCGMVPGQKIQMIHYRNQVRLIPIEPIENLRGFLKGIDTRIERAEDRL